MIAAHPETQPRFAILPPRAAVMPEAAAPSTVPAGDELKPFGEDGFTFLDVLDVINPLQHLPVIGTIYRELTGDTLSPASRVAGDILYGGPIGAFFGIANVFTESATGKDMGQHALAWLRDTLGPGQDAPPATQLANAATGTATAASSDVATADTSPPATAFRITPATAQPAASTDSALVTAMKLTEEHADNADIVDPRRVTFAPPTRSRIPLPPTQPLGTTVASAAVATAPPPDKAAGPSRLPATSLLGRTPLFAVVPPPPAPLFGAGPAPAAVPPTTASALPAGGTALDGGWFSETMLSALRKYEQDVTRRPAAAAPKGPVGANH